MNKMVNFFQGWVPLLWVFGGAIMVGAGGLAATYGWNLRSDRVRAVDKANEKADKRKATLHVLSLEMQKNLQKLNRRGFLETNEEKLKEPGIYSRLHVSVLESAITSNQFVSANDKELLDHLLGIHEMASLANSYAYDQFHIRFDARGILALRKSVLALRAGILQRIESLRTLLKASDEIDILNEPSPVPKSPIPTQDMVEFLTGSDAPARSEVEATDDAQP